MRDLISLGLSSGIVPCPAGVTLIVLAISEKTGNTWRCFVCLNAFSLGLGSVLVGIAVFMVLTRNFLVKNVQSERTRWLGRWLPVYSALFIALIGVGISAESFDPGFTRTWARVKATLS